MLSRDRPFMTPGTEARQAPLSMRFPRQEYCSGLNIRVIQVSVPISNAEEAEVERFYEDIQEHLELTPKLLLLSHFSRVRLCVTP